MAKPVTWGHTCSAYYELSKVLLMLRQDCMASGHILCITKYITGRSDMDGYLLLLLVASKPTNSLDLPYPAQTFTLAFNLHPSSLPPLAGSRFNLWEKSNMDFYSVANRHYSTYERCQTWISILWQVDTSCTVPFLANCTQHMALIHDVNKVITSYIVLVGSFTRKKWSSTAVF